VDWLRKVWWIIDEIYVLARMILRMSVERRSSQFGGKGEEKVLAMEAERIH
jgi:hypothetical protein